MSSWKYETADDLDQNLVDRLQRIPRRPDMLVWGMRLAMAVAIRGWFRTYHRFQIAGVENLPSDGPFVLVANHTSHLDVFCLLSALPIRSIHRAFPAAASDYFFVNIPRIAFVAVCVNALPFDRQTNFRHSMDLCRRILDSGNILIIFPEGTRSMNGALGTFHPGIGLLTAGMNVPVVPSAIEGGFAAWPKNAIFPRPRRLRLNIGKPRNFAELPSCKQSYQRIARDLQEAVEDLL